MNRNGPAYKFPIYGNDSNVHSTYHSNDQTPQIKTLRCVFCNQDKALDAFSKTQIQKATYNPYAPPGFNKKQHAITCKKCTPGQTTSLVCAVCNKKKPLDLFAKTQRRNGTEARCLKCMQKQGEGSDSELDSEASDTNEPRSNTWDDIIF